jgi:hypothetical protein
MSEFEPCLPCDALIGRKAAAAALLRHKDPRCQATRRNFPRSLFHPLIWTLNEAAYPRDAKSSFIHVVHLFSGTRPRLIHYQHIT